MVSAPLSGDRGSRLAEIRRRLWALDAEHRGTELPVEARAEVERLEAEAERLHLQGGEER